MVKFEVLNIGILIQAKRNLAQISILILLAIAAPVKIVAVAVREEMVGETVQQDGVLVQAAVAARATAIVDARGVHVGALRV